MEVAQTNYSQCDFGELADKIDEAKEQFIRSCSCFP